MNAVPLALMTQLMEKKINSIIITYDLLPSGLVAQSLIWFHDNTMVKTDYNECCAASNKDTMMDQVIENSAVYVTMLK